MKKTMFWFLFFILSGLLTGCVNNFSATQPPDQWVVVITVVVTATPEPSAVIDDMNERDIIIATALKATPTQKPSPSPTRELSATPTLAPTSTPTQEPSNMPSSRNRRLPTPVPDYVPGNGLAVLTGETPYEISILPGGWQAYQIGPSKNEWGYLVDINPHGPAPKGVYIESKILPEVSGGQWVDVLWLRAPGMLVSLPVTVDLISSQGWEVTYQNYTKLTPGEWTGWGMFDNIEGCGGILDISPDNGNQTTGVSIQNYRVQPEYPGSWVQVVRVQLSKWANGQNAWLRYYAPGSLGVEQVNKMVTLSPGTWNGFVLAPSYFRQGYVVEVMPQELADSEVAFAVVRPEANGETWDDVVRVYVPEDRQPLDVLLRVLSVKVTGN